MKTGFYYWGAPSVHSARAFGVGSLSFSQRDRETWWRLFFPHLQQEGDVDIRLFSGIVLVTLNSTCQVQVGAGRGHAKPTYSRYFCNQNNITTHTAGCGKHCPQWQRCNISSYVRLGCSTRRHKLEPFVDTSGSAWRFFNAVKTCYRSDAWRHTHMHKSVAADERFIRARMQRSAPLEKRLLYISVLGREPSLAVRQHASFIRVMGGDVWDARSAVPEEKWAILLPCSLHCLYTFTIVSLFMSQRWNIHDCKHKSN